MQFRFTLSRFLQMGPDSCVIITAPIFQIDTCKYQAKISQ